MTEPDNEAVSEYKTGDSVSPQDLRAQFEITQEEIAFYQDCIRIYPKGGIIIKEGDQEKALYLLRAGTVEVFKDSGASREAMGQIEAVSIFGEMSMINDAPRSATIMSATDNVMVYRIATPNIHTILTNPMWAEMLISRLCQNLARSIEQHVAVSEQVKELRTELERLKS